VTADNPVEPGGLYGAWRCHIRFDYIRFEDALHE
jgi:hypothetical protein